MREILFKGKRKDNGKWVEGYYQKRYDDFGNIQHLIFYSKSSVAWGYIEVYPETVCQYTGLTVNKDGRKIFEGDIVKIRYTDGNDDIRDVVCVNWNETGCGFDPFTWEYSCDGCDLYCSIEEIEVVGNIFDNPELIE